ncbi:amidohydrolase family protein [Gracilimonas amylolytica]|uniref:amidohydrolase family protein n=1 Tax=Gracilimonas amylolytica TaxID=1749045 RepID=UPI000CD953A9|nr:amidohydrolase family protein [Gracilimonas amylolytica]
MKFYAFLITLILSYSGLFAQDAWDVTNPDLGETSDLTFTTDEGTWMNLDVSPDGSQIVFDLLGDIYLLPIEGGEATLLRGGHAYEIQPRFSPDGSQILFTSDAGGGDNIWVMDTDGGNPKQITEENFRLLNNAVWTPDGEYIIAKKHFSSTRSLGAGEIWMYHKSGGAGVQLVEKANEQQDIGEPWVSPDGRYVYYSQAVYPGGYFQYNKDPNSQIYVIRRYDREDGDIETVTGGNGGAIRPQISPDGETLAFVRRVRTKTVLFLRDLDTGREWPVYQNLSKDMQEAWAIFGPNVNFNWLPDNRHIIIWANGKINKIDTETGESEVIPFQAESSHNIAKAVRFKQDVAPDKFKIKAIRQLRTSPDGRTLVWSAAGKLWSKMLPDGTPKRITNSGDFEFDPSFSADGKSVVYVSWNDEDMGAINMVKLNPSPEPDTPTKLTSEKGIYREPELSPDGKTIIFRKESGNGQLGFTHTLNPGIYTIPVKGGSETMITEEGAKPRFSPDGKRIWYQTGGYIFGSINKAYKSVDLSGNDEKTIFTSSYGHEFSPSPDGKWMAFSNLHKVYLAPIPKTGKTIEINPNTKAIPVKQISSEAGYHMHWSAESDKIHWTLGSEYFTVDLKNTFDFVDGAPDELPEPPTEGITLDLELDTYVPEGQIAFTNARIITMNGDEVIENGTIVVDGNKISAIGADVTVPTGAKVIDASGKTIMPGMVDVHAHVGNFRLGISPQQQWEYYANLAYGVTTVHDPSSNSEMIFSNSEAIKAGNMVGPRVYSTGVILYGADGSIKTEINSYEDALFALERTKAWGAFSVKSYNQPRREQRQQIIKAANELEMMVMPEGGSTFTHNMSMILDGHTGIEHNIPVAPLYKDVVNLWAASETGYTPTHVVNYGSMSGEYYWYQKSNVWENERLLTFTPRSVIDPRSRHRTMIPDEEYENGHILTAESDKKLADAGVKVNLGAHGQLQGLGAHWELWMFEQGGMSNHDALKVATINGAHYLGMDHEIGSLEVGKLADLVVLEKNPLENIRNTDSVTHTMVNGRLFDAATMNEVGNQEQERLPFWWERDGYDERFDWHAITIAPAGLQCTCFGTH